MDFALILILLTTVCGVIWAVDSLVFKRQRDRAATTTKTKIKDPIIVDYARSFFPILLIVVLIRSFWFEPFRIPSGSMVPTLLQGDFIVVNKYAYGLRVPILNNKFMDIGTPKRGDVVVFRLPSNPKVYYIKRLVGLPGDRIVYRDRRLFINDEAVPLEINGPYMGPQQSDALLVEERLHDVTHSVLHMVNRKSLEGVYTVPSGQYFMMGDNRDNSRDSRFREVGMVPEELLVGRAARIWMHLNFSSSPRVRWSRIGGDIS